jgi:hypothetical protein
MNLQNFQDFAFFCDIIFEARPKGRAYSLSLTKFKQFLNQNGIIPEAILCTHLVAFTSFLNQVSIQNGYQETKDQNLRYTKEFPAPL